MPRSCSTPLREMGWQCDGVPQCVAFVWLINADHKIDCIWVLEFSSAAATAPAGDTTFDYYDICVWFGCSRQPHMTCSLWNPNNNTRIKSRRIISETCICQRNRFWANEQQHITWLSSFSWHNASDILWNLLSKQDNAIFGMIANRKASHATRRCLKYCLFYSVSHLHIYQSVVSFGEL